MSRIHAFLIAIFVTGAVAVGAATAFTVANSPKTPGSALTTEMLQAQADKINTAEQRLADKLKDNPEPDRSPIIKTVSGGSSSGNDSYDDSDHSGSSNSGRGSDDDHAEDRDDDHGKDDDSDDHGGDDD